jgi:hypothetical protein
LSFVRQVMRSTRFVTSFARSVVRAARSVDHLARCVAIFVRSFDLSARSAASYAVAVDSFDRFAVRIVRSRARSSSLVIHPDKQRRRWFCSSADLERCATAASSRAP